MSDYGLTPNGFKRKQYADIVESMELKARELFGEKINLSNRSFMGLFIQLAAWFAGILWQLAEKVFYSGFVDTAEGRALDSAVKYRLETRQPARAASGEVTMYGDEGITIPLGFLVGTEDEVLYETAQSEVIPVSGEIVVQVVAVEPGVDGNAPAGAVTEIINPVAGIDSVLNADPITGGRSVENDPDLRARYFLGLAAAGAATINSIRAALLRTDGVRAASVVENDQDTIDGEGRPPHSIECYVLGGDPADVGDTLLNFKAAGIRTHGDEDVTVTDDSGVDRVMRFSYATVVPVYLNIELTTNNLFPANGEERIISALASYIGGEDVDGNTFTGLNMGENVVYTKLIDIIYNVPGIVDLDLEISTDDVTFVKENIPVAINEVAETDPDKVVVTFA